VNALTTITVVPGTSNAKALRFPSTFELKPNPSNGLTSPTTFLAFQPQSVDKKAVSSKIGVCSPDELALLDTALKDSLGL
jgi:mRNA-degrading endonuclease toxin of MazEF toxin-antitoxin module